MAHASSAGCLPRASSQLRWAAGPSFCLPVPPHAARPPGPARWPSSYPRCELKERGAPHSRPPPLTRLLRRAAAHGRGRQGPGRGRPRAVGAAASVGSNAAAAVLGSTAGALVPEEFADVLTFTAFAVVYCLAYSAYYFPPPATRPRVFEFTPAFRRYVAFFQWVGLVLPTAWLLAALAIGGPHKAWALRIAGPHQFLLLAQVLSEQICGRTKASLPLSIMVAALYNARRMLSLYVWVIGGGRYVRAALAGGSVLGGAQLAWLVFGQVLAVVSFLAWAYNLFFFLMPVAIPRYLKAHFEAEASLSEKNG